MMKLNGVSIIFLLLLTSSFITNSDGLYLNENFGSVNKTLVLQLVNDARLKGCKCGGKKYKPVPPLLWNEKLEKAAQQHSQDMARKKNFSHTGTDGSNAGERIQKTGYQWLAYGENIGMGFRDEKEMIEGWLKSPSHCKNIMSADYKEMGTARSGVYWTQTLGAR
ncbi:MAG: CAP domain-containing protein [Bacteroidota bacterium]